MNDFTASNGYMVSVIHDNHVELQNESSENTLAPEFVSGNDFLDMHDMQALREFFQAEADKRLGRWRDPADTVFVVYSGGAWDGVYSPIRVVAETNGASWLLDREDHEPNVPATVLAVSRRYFDAHPEPKPWHDAAAGEVWLLTVDREADVPAVASSSEGGHVVFTAATGGAGGTEEISPTTVYITAGRRIYPEVSS